MDSIKNEMINKLNGFSLNEITVYSCVIKLDLFIF
jgi:hypothetical protein